MMTSERVTIIETRVGQRRSGNSDEEGQLQVSEAKESAESLAVGMGVSLGTEFLWSKLPHPLQASLSPPHANALLETRTGKQRTLHEPLSHYITRVRCSEDDWNSALPSLCSTP